jgi:hypothetical protein
MIQPSANLICGIIMPPPAAESEVRSLLEEHFGPIELASAEIPFDFTDYYAAEFGPNLLRRWVSFVRLQPRDALAAIKTAANRLEDSRRGPDGRRTVNLDPGLLTMHNLVLASTKDYSHRVYLNRGIHAEVTLIYEHGGFRALPWTYRDYTSPAALAFFSAVRARYLDKLRSQPHTAAGTEPDSSR